MKRCKNPAGPPDAQLDIELWGAARWWALTHGGETLERIWVAYDALAGGGATPDGPAWARLPKKRAVSLTKAVREASKLKQKTLASLDAAVETLWQTSPDARAMLRVAAHLLPREGLVVLACAAARTTLPYVSAGDLRPLRAIETAEAWARGAATLAQVRAAMFAESESAADDDTAAVYAAGSAVAADSDAAAADAAYAAASAAASAVDDAVVAAGGPPWTRAYAARLAQLADLLRSLHHAPSILAALARGKLAKETP